jgi:hypothetical protein
MSISVVPRHRNLVLSLQVRMFEIGDDVSPMASFTGDQRKTQTKGRIMGKRIKREPATEVERARNLLREAEERQIRKIGELVLDIFGQSATMIEIAGAIKFAMDNTTRERRLALGEEWFLPGNPASSGRNARSVGSNASTISSEEAPGQFTSRRPEPWDETDIKLV